jgi:hypothetical protein
MEGARDRSYEWVKESTSPVGTMEPRRPTIGRRYQPQQRNLVLFWRLLGPFTLVARVPGASEIGKVFVIGRVVLLGAKHRD